jgi:uncharacterized protein YpmB
LALVLPGCTAGSPQCPTEAEARTRALKGAPLATITAVHRSATAALITPECPSWLLEGADKAGRPLQAQLSADDLLYHSYIPPGLTKAAATAKAQAVGWASPEGGPALVLPYATGFQPYWLIGENRFIDPRSGQALSGPPLPLKAAIALAKGRTPLRTTQEREVWDVSQNLLMIGGWDAGRRPLAVWVGAAGVRAWTYLDAGISATDAERRSIPHQFQWLGQSIIEDPTHPAWSMRAITTQGELVEFLVDLKSGAERILRVSNP